MASSTRQKSGQGLQEALTVKIDKSVHELCQELSIASLRTHWFPPFICRISKSTSYISYTPNEHGRSREQKTPKWGPKMRAEHWVLRASQSQKKNQRRLYGLHAMKMDEAWAPWFNSHPSSTTKQADDQKKKEVSILIFLQMYRILLSRTSWTMFINIFFYYLASKCRRHVEDDVSRNPWS